MNNLKKRLTLLEKNVNDSIPNSDLKEISDMILEAATTITSSQNGYVAYVDPENGDSVGISFSHMTGACENYARMGEARFKVLKDGSYGGLLGYSLDTGESLYTNNPSSHPIAHGLPPGHEPVHQFLTVAVKDNDQILGQIVLGNCEHGYDTKDVDLAEKIGSIYAIALKKLLWKKEK
jgi:GAF domain-containing protein